MIINNTYFVGGAYYIAQIGTAPVQATVNRVIEKNEPRLLRLLLGIPLYDALIAGAYTDPIPDPIADRWNKLLNGDQYTDYSGNVRMWDGLKSTDTSNIMCYVYYHYLNGESIKLAGSGPVVPKAENASRVNTISQQVGAWNEMVKQNVSLFRYLSAKRDMYPEWPYYDVYECQTWPEDLMNSHYFDQYGRLYQRQTGDLGNLLKPINMFNL